MDVITSFFMSIIAGIMSGFVVIRIAEFNDLKTQARQVLNLADTLTNKSLEEYKVYWEPKLNELLSIACVMLSRKHKKAGDEIFGIIKTIRDDLWKLKESDMTGNNIINLGEHQDKLAKLKPRY